MIETHVVDLLPEYVLGTLGDVESRQVQNHLEHCAACQRELLAYQRVMGQIPLAVHQIDPPQSVKERLFYQIGAEKGANAGKRFHLNLSVWSLVSLAVIVALATINLFLWQRVQSLSARNAQQFRVVELTHTDAAPQAYAWLVLSPDGEYGTLIVDGLPQLGNEQTYQLWLIRGEQRTSGGVFMVGQDGYGSVWVVASDPLSSFGNIGITIEPAGGSQGPTGERVLTGNL